MFTGIVEQRGSVVSVESANGGMRLVLDTGANRSVVTNTVVQQLGRTLTDANTVKVHGITGQARVSSPMTARPNCSRPSSTARQRLTRSRIESSCFHSCRWST